MANQPHHHPGGPPPVPPAAPGLPGANPQQLIDVTPGTAFKAGFFFTLGAGIAGLIFAVIYFIVIFVILGSIISSMMQPSPFLY